MTDYTKDAHALPYPEGVDRVAVAADMQALAVRASLAISTEGARVEAALLPIVGALEAAIATEGLIENGSFRRGFVGWGATTGWNAENNGITSWVRAATGSAGLLAQSVTVPAHALGRSLRLKALVNTTSAGTYRSRITTAAGATDVSHVLAVNSWSEKAVDIPIPANQGTTPITIQVGRTAGVVYMTSVRLEAL